MLVDWTGAARYLGTSERHVKKMWAERKLAGVKIGKFVRFDTKDLDAFIDAKRVRALR